MPKARTIVDSWESSVEWSKIDDAKEKDFHNWTPAICAGVINYEVECQDGKIFLVRLWRARNVAKYGA